MGGAEDAQFAPGLLESEQVEESSDPSELGLPAPPSACPAAAEPKAAPKAAPAADAPNACFAGAAGGGGARATGASQAAA